MKINGIPVRLVFYVWDLPRNETLLRIDEKDWCRLWSSDIDKLLWDRRTNTKRIAHSHEIDADDFFRCNTWWSPTNRKEKILRGDALTSKITSCDIRTPWCSHTQITMIAIRFKVLWSWQPFQKLENTRFTSVNTMSGCWTKTILIVQISQNECRSTKLTLLVKSELLSEKVIF